MLKIQRASAGSGKTYALAKNYILNLIAFKSNKGGWQLRNERQIEDALTHILAITFTNKATNEMKERIVKNLSLLSKARGSLSENSAQSIPYLKDFINLTGASCKEIGSAAERALKVILNNYSLFKISTIDSFFQEILRTFTYEANLNDSYQLEIDSTFVTDAAIDSTIQDLDTRPSKMGNAAFWLKDIIGKEAKKSQRWNIFNKRATARSVYSKLRETLGKLGNEDFKDIKENLEEYFNSPDKIEHLTKTYADFRIKARDERRELLDEIKKSASISSAQILNNSIPLDKLNKNFVSHLEIVKNLKEDEEIGFQFNKIIKDNSVFLKKFRVDNHPLDEEAIKMYSLLTKWNNPTSDSYYKNWLIYGELIPYLGLILEIKSFLSSVLESNNLIQLSDTSYILKKIIGDSDAPFIYERLGNRIDNYLIDEFQDTSKMQWNVLFPLLEESEARGDDSLIIGDPKQSIYRFRNADHSLITTVVPSVFPNHTAAGYSIEDNTNWRSHTNIVKFNNYFFTQLADIISGISENKGLPINFNNLYSNVVQHPHNHDNKGYVEIRFMEASETSSAGENDNTESSVEEGFENVALNNLGPLISSLIERGYSQKDIGILVNQNDKGKKIIEYLISYNETLPSTLNKIDFISEESLLVSSSPAVELIIGVLKKISDPGLLTNSDSQRTGAEENEDFIRKYYNWNKLKTDYNIYSSEHRDVPIALRMMNFLEHSDLNNSLQRLIETLPTPSLTSMVESIIDTFLDEEMKASEALYITSLQDLVNEYCANHANDPASFLEWWQSRGNRMSVSSPTGINAVQIMTIHKSKGLEFKCVILPFASDSFMPAPGKEEWRWVEPKLLEGLELPPVLPIKTTSLLVGSEHEKYYKEYVGQVLTDKLNMFYVALTRAKNELYVFSKMPPKKIQLTFPSFLHEILLKEDREEKTIPEMEKEWTISKCNDLCISEDQRRITLGKPFTKEEIHKENIKEIEKEEVETKYFNEYYINKKRPRLRSVASSNLQFSEQ